MHSCLLTVLDPASILALCQLEQQCCDLYFPIKDISAHCCRVNYRIHFHPPPVGHKRKVVKELLDIFGMSNNLVV